ncbi:U3 small nucleolar ribonucleoprotein protein IMP3-like [Erythrolamprus reginae]|uniref:U3 small nucleolar ribonucleoprotein protein IMP3-like n=1 Tax=Erythrolamprus reginae TaxID=121349 RepID=UPI00396CE4DC
MDLQNNASNLAELHVLRHFRIQRREDYTRYNQLSRAVRELACRIRDLGDVPESAGFRTRSTAALLDKLYPMGVIPSKSSLELCCRVSASSFCRRRLPCLIIKLRMAQNLKSAVTFVEQGHIWVGPEVITDPAFLVTRAVEDFITWTDSSRIRQHVLNYNQERDDFDFIC